MLKRLVEFSLRSRGAVIVLALLAGAYGLYSALGAKLDVFPEFAPPLVVIQTEAPGLTARQVETLVTRPIEYALNGTPQLSRMYSQSIQALSVVTLIFHGNADIYRVRQLTAERLAQLAGSLPRGVEAPRMGQLTSTTSLTLVLGLTSRHLSPMQLRTFAQWVVRQRLLAVPGVARVELFGGEVRELQVRYHPARLVAYGIPLNQLLAAARDATGIRGAGFIDNANQRLVLRTEGQALTPSELGEVVVAHHAGFSVRLKDVATVALGAAPSLGGGLVNGKPGVVVMVHSQYGSNTLDVTAGVDRALAKLRPLFAARQVRLHASLFRPANFIEASIRNIGHSLLIGGIFVLAVLFVFLANVRSAFIAFITIPLSLLTAMIVLRVAGASINTITLGGFAISVGVVVDDAIVGLENVWRRLRESRERQDGRSVFVVIRDATLEVRSPIIYATFIVAAVFIPVLTMSGVNGRLFAPLGVAFLLATFASLLIAVTLTPALCHVLLPSARIVEPRYIAWLKRRHRMALEAVARHSRWVIAGTAIACLLAAALLPFFGGDFMPDFKEGHYIVRMTLAPGSSLAASLRVGSAISEALLRDPDIRSVSQEAGRAEQGEDTEGPEYSELHVELRPSLAGSEAAVADRIRATVAKVPGVTFSVTSFLAERMEEVLSGASGEVVVKLLGNRLGALDRAASRVQRILGSIPGAVDVFSQVQTGAPEMTVTLRRRGLEQFGYDPLTVLKAVETSYQGSTVAQTYQDNRVFNVVVLLERASRRNPDALGSLLVENSHGLRLPLRELATVRLASGRFLIEHEDTVRRRLVSCDAEGRDLSSFVAELKHRLATQLRLPRGVTVELGGAAKAQSTAEHELLWHSVIAGVLILVLLSLVFGRTRDVLLVLANLPFALAGGVLAALLSGASLSIGSLVGFISLFGISARNSILLISHYRELVSQEGLPWGLETAIRGAIERLLPILMTALVVALALLPIALHSGQAGDEIEGPMAIVILGGLVTSTTLNLLVLPALAVRFGRFDSAGDGRTPESPPDSAA